MALHVSEMGVQIKIGEQEAPASDEACASDDDDAKQKQQERLVAETVRRVLEILKLKGAR